MSPNVSVTMFIGGPAAHFCELWRLIGALTSRAPAPAGLWTRRSSSWTLRGSSSRPPACTGPVCATAPPSTAAPASAGVSPSASPLACPAVGEAHRKHLSRLDCSDTVIEGIFFNCDSEVLLPPPLVSHRCPPASPRPCPGWRPSAGPAALSLVWQSHIWPPARPSRASLPSALWSLHLWPVVGIEDGSG